MGKFTKFTKVDCLTQGSHSMKLDSLGARVKFRREELDLTQEQLAERCGTYQDLISKIERGVSKRPRMIEKLAEALKTSPAWLQFGIEELDQLDRDAVEVALIYSDLTDDQKAALRAVLDTYKDKKN